MTEGNGVTGLRPAAETDLPAGWNTCLRTLREEATALVRALPGPVAEVRVRAGGCALEVSWAAAGTPAPAPAAESPPADEPEAEDGLVTVTAPMVGTFYAAPAPGAEPFVRVGDLVERGQDLGIVEAMKLMNHVTAEQAGEVVAVPVADGEPVEFGQPLVVVRPVAE